MNRHDKMLESPQKDLSDFIQKVYEILDYATSQDVFHYIEEAPKRIITVKSTGQRQYLVMDDRIQEKIQETRAALDKFEELFK